MAITIEKSTAEAIFEALKDVPMSELVRLRGFLPAVDESTEWSDEDLHDFSNAGNALYDEIELNETKNASSG